MPKGHPKGQANKRYTAEFKKQVVETMQAEKLSYSETVRQFEVSDHHLIQAWERIYLEEGAQGFEVERRGRARTGGSCNLHRILTTCTHT